MLHKIKNYLNLYMLKSERSTAILDNCGIGISLLCSIHCAAMPILILTSAIAGWHLETLERLESPLFLLAAVIGSFSVVYAYLQKRRSLPMLLLLIGLSMILLGGMIKIEWLEPVLRVSGSVFIIFAHIQNKKTQKQHAYEA